jgi:hypothetical protein
METAGGALCIVFEPLLRCTVGVVVLAFMMMFVVATF